MTANNDRPLNDLMQFDHIVKVGPDGAVSDGDISAYFELSTYKGDDGEWHENFQLPDGWELLRGFTGQYSYNGPVMHPSEFIGGGLERHIRETPGYYVALTVESDCGYTEPNCTEDAGCDCEPDGWAVAYRPLDTAPTTEDGN